MDETVGEVLEITLAVLAGVEVFVSAEAEMNYKISPCSDSNSRIEAKAERKLKTDGKSVIDPADKVYYDRQCAGGLASCTATRQVKVDITGSTKAKCYAKGGWYAEGGASSLWASVWAGCCVCDDKDAQNDSKEGNGNNGAHPKKYTAGYGFDMQFFLRIPSEAIQEVSGEVAALAIENSLRDKLKELLDEVMKKNEDTAPPCSDPDAVEHSLREVLLSWYDWLVEDWGLFPEADFEGI
jgi:hypothetical protein